MRVLVWLGLFLVACKGKGGTPAHGSGSASAPVVADAATAVDAAPKAGLRFDDKSETVEAKLAFDNHVPVLPALSADRAWVADYDSDIGMPMFPTPIYVAIRRLDGKGTSERLEIVDDKLAEEADNHEPGGWEQTPPPPATVKLLRERGAAIVKRLDGFVSLERVELPVNSNGDPQPTKIGGGTLTSKIDGDTLVVTLGALLARVETYFTDEKPESFLGGACNYRPDLGSVYRDPAGTKLYLEVGFHFNEECTPQPQRWIVWDLPTPEDDAMAALVAAQFDPDRQLEKWFTKDAQLVNGTAVTDLDGFPYIIKAGTDTYTGHEDDNLQVVRSRDGKSAWASLTTKLSILPRNEKGRDDPWRASSVLVKTADGWRIAATMWTEPVANATANKNAKAGKLKTPPPFTIDAGDAGLAAAFAKLVSDGLDADAAARADLVAIGSGPNERTVGGAALAPGWNAGWKGKARVVSSIARVLPSGTTGWVAASVELPKTGYTMPFLIFAVFDKTASGAWSLVHIHFSV